MRAKNTTIEAYINSDQPFHIALKSLRKQPSKIAQAIFVISECLAGIRFANEAINTARQVQIKGSDPNMVILLFALWAELSARINRHQEAAVLIREAYALLSDHVLPEIHTAILIAEATLADITGNRYEAEEKIKESLKILKPESPRYIDVLWRLGYLYTLQFRHKEGETIISTLEQLAKSEFQIYKINLLKYILSMERGNISMCEEIQRSFKKEMAVDKDISEISLPFFEEILKLYRLYRYPYLNVEVKDLPALLPLKCLLLKQPLKALQYGREMAERSPNLLLGSGLTAFNLIRAELANNSPHAALRQLEIRHKRKNFTPCLDDLFEARAHYLLNHNEHAKELFYKAYTIAKENHAIERFNFELTLATELTPMDIVNLLNISSEKISVVSSDSEKKSTIVSHTTEGITAEEKLGIEAIIGVSPAIQEVRKTVLRFANLDTPVLILGETGTGKELVARALHEHSKRKDFPFTAVNCGAITETLLESELFGHEKGAFTGAEKANIGLFEATGEGTILLDEIGELPPGLQVAMLRVLETGEIRAVGSTKTRKIKCRIIASTNADLFSLVEKGLFRQDLLYRLQRLVIEIPPLRERKEDIIPLFRYFLNLGRPTGVEANLSEDLIEVLLNYNWPGNVRELRNIAERMRLLHSDKLSYTKEDLDIKLRISATSPTKISLSTAKPSSEIFPQMSDSYSKQEILSEILKSSNSTIRKIETLKNLFIQFKKLTRSEIAKLLNISPNTATNYLKILCKEKFIKRVEPSASTRSYYFELISPEGRSS